MNTIRMTMKKLQVNTKFVNNLLPEWSKFVTDVKLAKGMYKSSFDQLYAYLRQHEVHANEVCMMREIFPDPPALVANSYNTPPYCNNHQPYVPQLDSGLAVPSFLPTNDLIASLNKAMAFISKTFSSGYLPTNNQLRTSSNLRNQATIQDGEGHMARQCTEPKRPKNSEWFKEKILLAQALKTDDLDAFDSDCDEAPSASAVLMAKLSAYDQMLFRLRKSAKNENEVFKDTTSSEQQDAMIMSIIEEMSNQVAKYNAVNQENKSVNESLTSEIERYKEHVKNFEERQKFDLNDRKNILILIFKKHDPLSVIDSEETLDLAEATRLKMSEKQNDPIVKEKRVNIKPIDYGSLNELYKHFVPKKQLYFEIQKKELLIENERLFEKIISQDFVCIAMHSCDDLVKYAEIEQRMYKLDLQPLSPKLRKNMEDHADYLKQTKEHADTLHDIVEQARALQPLDSTLDYALNSSTHAGRSKPKGNTRNNRISRTSSSNLKSKKVEDHPRNAKTSLNKKNHVFDCIASTMHVVLNANFEFVCFTCNECLFNVCHDLCVVDYFNAVNSYTRAKSGKSNKKNEWKPIGRTDHPLVLGLGLLQAYDQTRLSAHQFCQKVYGNQGLRHNLFLVGQFCEVDLEVAFSKHWCFVHDQKGVDLLKGLRGINLYTFSLEEMMKSSLIFLLSKDSKTKLWLWHRRLSHLNFDTINKLVKQGLVRGLPKFKYKKDPLCSAYSLVKSKKHTHKPKSENFIQEKLYLLHMDLCGLMRIEIINVQVRLIATVRNISTDNGTEFVNQMLKAYYEDAGISHQTTVARTPQQNGVV
ncbi:retrovirus-related pol polyprotein from transposon TNT 1-94 [Tanacetum coccineum]